MSARKPKKPTLMMQLHHHSNINSNKSRKRRFEESGESDESDQSAVSTPRGNRNSQYFHFSLSMSFFIYSFSIYSPHYGRRYIRKNKCASWINPIAVMHGRAFNLYKLRIDVIIIVYRTECTASMVL